MHIDKRAQLDANQVCPSDLWHSPNNLQCSGLSNEPTDDDGASEKDSP